MCQKIHIFYIGQFAYAFGYFVEACISLEIIHIVSKVIQNISSECLILHSGIDFIYFKDLIYYNAISRFGNFYFRNC